MYPIAGRLGPFFLYSYAIAFWLGIASGGGLTCWWARRHGRFLQVDRWIDAALVGLGGAIVGGRIEYVAHEWTFFQAQPVAAGQVWAGGLHYHGAFAGGLLAMWAWQALRRQPLGPTLDLLAPGLALLHSFGWAACWLEGCAYGRATFLRGTPWLDWLAAALPDTYGVFALRYQTQLLGASGSLLVLLYLLRQRPAATGSQFLVALGLLSLGRIPVTLLRGDTAALWAGWRYDLWLDAILVMIALVLLQYQQRRRRAAPGQETK